MGVEAVACDSAESFTDALRSALDHRGPRLIDAVIPRGF
jgi:thiamine pyrophosphate-dependent acetolactate synthase large subunit-like protein